MLCSLSHINTDELDELIDNYDVRYLSIKKIGKFNHYNYIISENDILGFLSELPYEYFVKYVFDDILYQINIIKNIKNKFDIYRNNLHDKLPHYKVIRTKFEIDIYNLCKYIEKNYI
jgi:hypothetical protein